LSKKVFLYVFGIPNTYKNTHKYNDDVIIIRKCVCIFYEKGGLNYDNDTKTMRRNRII